MKSMTPPWIQCILSIFMAVFIDASKLLRNKRLVNSKPKTHRHCSRFWSVPTVPCAVPSVVTAAEIVLTADAAVMTAVANDYGYDAVFARQVEALGRPGDVAVGLTTSGVSANSGQVKTSRRSPRARRATAVLLAERGGYKDAPWFPSSEAGNEAARRRRRRGRGQRPTLDPATAQNPVTLVKNHCLTRSNGALGFLKAEIRLPIWKAFDRGLGGLVPVANLGLPFNRFPGVDIVLGPEMRSTGEVMGIGPTFGVDPEPVTVSCFGWLVLKITVPADLKAVAAHVSRLPACNGKVAVAGFCWGGTQTVAFFIC